MITEVNWKNSSKEEIKEEIKKFEISEIRTSAQVIDWIFTAFEDPMAEMMGRMSRGRSSRMMMGPIPELIDKQKNLYYSTGILYGFLDIDWVVDYHFSNGEIDLA